MLLAFIDFSFETLLWGVLVVLVVYLARQIFTPPPPPPRPRPAPQPIVLREYSKEELLRCTGADPSTPILIAIKGKVYDVTRGRNFYGPGTASLFFIIDCPPLTILRYGVFAGHDASCALAKGSLEAVDLDKPIDDLTPAEVSTLNDWIGMYEGKYGCVGWLEGSVQGG